MKDKIVVILGSKSDMESLKEGLDLLKSLKLNYSLDVISAHRHPEKLRQFCMDMEKNGATVVIACAGMAAALPGAVAAYVNIPVIGVAMKGGMLDGLDAVMSIVSIPKGLGVCCSGVGKSAFINAVILSLEILALKDKKYRSKLLELKNNFK
jgi:5-(carboxyamino)imidazole ribonucleotide mutase